MTDISMCMNYKCPLRDTCYRYRAVANGYRQSFAGFSYDDGCNHYWNIEGMSEESLTPVDEADKMNKQFFKKD